MKTFLWTSLFWIIVAIAGLLCLGFGNLGTKVLDNEWMVDLLPNNVQTKACDPVVETALESIDWCEQAQNAECNLDIATETGDSQGIQSSIDVLSQNQMKIYEEMKASFASLENKISSLNTYGGVPVENDIERQLMEKREQQRKELQAQIEALQSEMANL